MFYEYRDFVIYPVPRLVDASGCWRTHLAIRWKNRIEFFSGDRVFPTKAEAVFNSIDYGKRVIDEGLYPAESDRRHPASSSSRADEAGDEAARGTVSGEVAAREGIA